LTNGHLKKYDEKDLDEFHNVKAHIVYSVAEYIDGKNSAALIMITPCIILWSGNASVD